MENGKREIISLTEWKRSNKAGDLSGDEAVYKTFYPEEIKVFDGEDGLPQLAFTISTESRDRDGDRIMAKGWEFDNYLKNPVVFFAHNSSGLPIGQAVELSITADNRTKGTVRFDTDIEEYALPRTVVALLRRGTLRATSVGFIPQEFRSDQITPEEGIAPDSFYDPLLFTKQEMIEFSVVPIPSNPEALMEARSAGVDISPVVNWAGEILDSYGGAAAKGLWIPRKTLEVVALSASGASLYHKDGNWDIELGGEIKADTEPEIEPEKEAPVDEVVEKEDPVLEEQPEPVSAEPDEAPTAEPTNTETVVQTELEAPTTEKESINSDPVEPAAVVERGATPVTISKAEIQRVVEAAIGPAIEQALKPFLGK